MIKVLITGTFDIIHPGHLHLIKQAKQLGDFLTVVIARDQNVVKVKGRPAHFDENQRLANLQKLGLADKVVLGDLTDPYKMLGQENPDIVVLGYDQQAFVNGLIDLRNNSEAHFKIERLQPFKEDICKGKNLRSAVENLSAGFLLINKQEDWTSHDAVAKLRSILKIKQIGHVGTLDPFATGLLICAIGSATKMTGLFDLLPKTYEAQIRLGRTSDTYDRTGKTVVAENFQLPAEQQIRQALESFIGKQSQIPPMYSAKKVGGQKLYYLARLGKEIERQPSWIEIYSAKLLEVSGDVLKLEVKCSAGTYIRSLAHDLGQKLGTGALLNELKRIAIGNFNLWQAAKLDQVTLENYHSRLIAPMAALQLINRSYFSQF